MVNRRLHFLVLQKSSYAALGRECGISRQAAHQYVNGTKGAKVPLKHVPTFARILGISENEVRPDLEGRLGNGVGGTHRC